MKNQTFDNETRSNNQGWELTKLRFCQGHNTPRVFRLTLLSVEHTSLLLTVQYDFHCHSRQCYNMPT